MNLSYEDFLRAQREMEGILQITPLVESEKLSALIQGHVYLKYEHSQLTHSFKARGAYTALLSLSDADKIHGVVVAAVGNYGKAVAYFGQKMNIPVHIIFPHTSKGIKTESCIEHGAHVEFKGDTFEEALEAARRIAEHQKKPFLTCYHMDTIRGYGTVGIELTDQKKPPLDALIIPMGTGCLASGIGRVLNARWPMCALYGAQTLAAPTMAEKVFMFRTTRPRPLETEAEELFIKHTDPELIKDLTEYLSDIFVVTDDVIEKAMHHCLRFERQVVEFSGVLGIAALFQNPHAFKEKSVGIIICGGNTDILEQLDIV